MTGTRRFTVRTGFSNATRPLLKVIGALALVILVSSVAGAPGGVYGAQPTIVDVLSLTKTLVDPPVGPATVGDIVRFEVELHNYASSYIVGVPMLDRFDGDCMGYLSASPPPDSVNLADDLLLWYDLGPMGLGDTRTIQVDFLAIAACDPAWNRAGVRDAVTVHGNLVSPVLDEALVTIMNDSELWRLWLPLIEEN